MSEIRRVYVQTAASSLDLLRSDELGTAWDDVSALAAFRVSGLAGHLARSIFLVEEYIDAQISGQPPITAAVYFGELANTADIGTSENMSVRDRGDRVAKEGREVLADMAEQALHRIAALLDELPPARRVTVYGHKVMLLDEYLKTRIVELVVHSEDLALSIGSGVGLPVEAIEIATDTVVAAARQRHGDLAFLRGMTRRERDDINATRLF